MKFPFALTLFCGALLASCSNPSNNNIKEPMPLADTSHNFNSDTKTNDTMKGYSINIEKSTNENSDFRRVLYTAKHMQLVLMSLKTGEEIGEETHPEVDQFFRFEGGTGTCTINGVAHKVESGDIIIVPAGNKHNVINTGQKDLKLYTIYARPNHKDGVVRGTKKDAEEQEEKFDGKTTE